MLHPATEALDPNFNPAGKGRVERHVATKGVDPIGRGEGSSRVINGAWGQIRVLPGQEDPQVIAENNFLKRTVKLDAMDVPIPETLQPLDGRKLELGFAAPVRHDRADYPE
jgi:hypothetical protein